MTAHASVGVDVVIQLQFASINDVSFTDEAFHSALTSFSPNEQAYITKYVFMDDKKRSLLGKLLQRALIRQTFTEQSGGVRLSSENKPYYSSSSSPAQLQWWNFNLSHHGSFVGIAGHADYLIGVDIVDITTRSRGTRTCFEYVSMFAEQLTAYEMDIICQQASEEAKYSMFFIYWSLKEAFIKAVGMGLGYPLQQVEFTVQLKEGDLLSGHATVSIVGTAREDWMFAFLSLDAKHVASVALGPLSDAIDSFKACAWRNQPPPAHRPAASLEVIPRRTTFQELTAQNITGCAVT